MGNNWKNEKWTRKDKLFGEYDEELSKRRDKKQRKRKLNKF